VLAVPNKTESIYMRLWCVAEAMMAMENGITTKVACTKRHTWADLVKVMNAASNGNLHTAARHLLQRPATLAAYELGKGSFAGVHTAKCSDANDELRIRAALHGKEQDINDMIEKLTEQLIFSP